MNAFNRTCVCVESKLVNEICVHASEYIFTYICMHRIHVQMYSNIQSEVSHAYPCHRIV